MAIEGFDYKEQVIGTNDTNQYSFDFFIFDDTDLLIYVQDDSGNLIGTYRGDDTSFLSGITFDTTNGGGTVTLINDLPDSYVMTMFLANDAPDQPGSFPNARSFTFDAIEYALDFIAACVQRVAYLAQRSVKLHDLDDIDGFNPTLPMGMSENPLGVLSVNEAGNGFEIGITLTDIANAEGYASEAQTSAANSAASATASAASAAAAAISAEEAEMAAAGGYTILPNVSLPAQNPQVVNPAVSLPLAGVNREMIFVSGGSSGPQVMSANPQIVAGLAPGNELTLVGCDGTNTIKFVDGNGMFLNGDAILGSGDTLGLVWNGQQWSEIFRRSAS